MYMTGNLYISCYVVLNPKSKVAELTDASTELSIEDIEAYAQMINDMYKLPVMYIEYSGHYEI